MINNEQESEEFEYKIYLAWSPEGNKENQNLVSEAKIFANNIKNSPDGIMMCLTNFANFKQHTTLQFTLDILEHWLNYRFNDIAPEMWQAVFHFLTVSVLSKYGKFQAKTAESLANAQAMLTIRTCIKIFPDIAMKFLEIGKKKKIIALRYIESLFKEFSTFDLKSNELHQAILLKFSQDGSLQAMTQMMLSDVKRDNAVAYRILKYYTKFGDISFFDANLINSLLEQIKNKERGINIPIILLHLMHRQDSLENKMNILKIVNIQHLLLSNSNSNDNFKKIIAKYAILLSYCGFTFDNEYSFYDISLQYGNISPKVSNNLLLYLNSFSYKHKEKATNSFDFALQNMRNYIEKITNFKTGSKNMVATFVKNDFIDSLTQICANCFTLDPEKIGTFLITHLSNQNLPNDIPLVISIFLIFLKFIKFQIPLTPFNSYISEIITILISQQSKQSDINDIIASLYFSTYSFLIEFDDMIISPSQIFSGIIPFATNNNLYQSRFIHLLVSCCSKYGSNIELNQYYLNIFIQNNFPIFGYVFGAIINCMPVSNQSLMIKQSISNFSEILQNNLSNENVLYFSLNFLSTLKCPPDSEALNSIAQYILNLLTLCQTLSDFDSVLAKIIKGIFSLSLSGTQIMVQIYPQINSVKSLASISKLATLLRSLISKINISELESSSSLQIALDGSWVPKIIEHLISCLSNLSTNSLLFDEFGMINYLKFIKNLTIFISSEISNLIVHHQLYDKLIMILINEANKFYDSPTIFESLFTLSTSLLSCPSISQNPEYIQSFCSIIQVSLNFLFTDKIDLLSDKWTSTITRMVIFYKQINDINPQIFQQSFSNAVQSIVTLPFEHSIQSFYHVLTMSENTHITLISAINFCSELLMNKRYI